jgi:hypothetical protein
VNASEATDLARIVAELCPTQKFTARTGVAWSMVLHDIPYAQAEAAVIRVYRELGDDKQWNRTIDADDIFREVRRRRRELIDAQLETLSPPDELRDDPVAYVEWLREATKALGDGHQPRQSQLPRVRRPLELGTGLNNISMTKQEE